MKELPCVSSFVVVMYMVYVFQLRLTFVIQKWCAAAAVSDWFLDSIRPAGGFLVRAHHQLAVSVGTDATSATCRRYQVRTGAADDAQHIAASTMLSVFFAFTY